MAIKAPAEEQAETIEDLRVDQLLLDEQNPRLAAQDRLHGQRELLKFMWNQMAVDEIALSIAKNGFFEEEKLFVVPQTRSEPHSDTKKYVVVEGNRRLAAVKILLDSSLREDLRATDLPVLTAEDAAKLERLPVSVYQTRRELWQYFGFRHINGPKPWDSYSKAVYVAEVHEKYHVRLDDIADSIGDRHSTVRRLYRGLKLLQQAEAQAGWDREDRVKRRLSFSHIYTAAAQPEFQRFLGITEEGSVKKDPVARRNLPQLKELVLWLYGSKAANRPPLVVTQNPDLNQLREAISSNRGLDAVRAGFSLSRALEISIGDERRFREALTKAKEDILQAKGTVTTGYRGERDLLDVINDISKNVEKLQEEMRSQTKVKR